MHPLRCGLPGTIPITFFHQLLVEGGGTRQRNGIHRMMPVDHVPAEDQRDVTGAFLHGRPLQLIAKGGINIALPAVYLGRVLLLLAVFLSCALLPLLISRRGA